MRASLSIVIVLLLATAGSRGAVAAQGADQVWWEWAGETVSREAARIAVPRDEVERESRTRTPTTGSRDDRVVTTDRRTEAQPPAGRGRGAGRGEAGPPQGRGRGNAGGGPAFCRSGAGHPVFGWQWCAQRGFSRGRPEWRRETWETRVPRWPRQPREERIDSGRLVVVLGSVVFGQVQAHARQIDARDPLEGRWMRPRGGNALVLQIRAGNTPIAELSDTTGDRRVDMVLVNQVRW